jgi:polyhydroxybutyrate depolymerase
LKVPAGYDGSTPLPLVVAMHSYGSDGAGLESYFGLDPAADERGLFVVYPDGTVDASGRRFFSATGACCDFYDTGVDDVAFVEALIDRIESTYAIDTSRVYAIGHSNGGFMSYRLACDLSERFAAIVSLEGAMWDDPTRCHPTAPVAVLEVHGTDDVIISPAGGDVVDGYPDRVYPPLSLTMASWATLDGCDGTTRPGPDPGTLDDETSQPTVARMWNGCRAEVELWMNVGGTHFPQLTPQWPVAVLDFLLSHPRVQPTAALVSRSRGPRSPP